MRSTLTMRSTVLQRSSMLPPCSSCPRRPTAACQHGRIGLAAPRRRMASSSQQHTIKSRLSCSASSRSASSSSDSDQQQQQQPSAVSLARLSEALQKLGLPAQLDTADVSFVVRRAVLLAATEASQWTTAAAAAAPVTIQPPHLLLAVLQQRQDLLALVADHTWATPETAKAARAAVLEAVAAAEASTGGRQGSVVAGSDGSAVAFRLSEAALAAVQRARSLQTAGLAGVPLSAQALLWGLCSAGAGAWQTALGGQTVITADLALALEVLTGKPSGSDTSSDSSTTGSQQDADASCLLGLVPSLSWVDTFLDAVRGVAQNKEPETAVQLLSAAIATLAEEQHPAPNSSWLDEAWQLIHSRLEQHLATADDGKRKEVTGHALVAVAGAAYVTVQLSGHAGPAVTKAVARLSDWLTSSWRITSSDADVAAALCQLLPACSSLGLPVDSPSRKLLQAVDRMEDPFNPRQRLPKPLAAQCWAEAFVVAMKPPQQPSHEDQLLSNACFKQLSDIVCRQLFLHGDTGGAAASVSPEVVVQVAEAALAATSVTGRFANRRLSIRTAAASVSSAAWVHMEGNADSFSTLQLISLISSVSRPEVLSYSGLHEAKEGVQQVLQWLGGKQPEAFSANEALLALEAASSAAHNARTTMYHYWQHGPTLAAVEQLLLQLLPIIGATPLTRQQLQSTTAALEELLQWEWEGENIGSQIEQALLEEQAAQATRQLADAAPPAAAAALQAACTQVGAVSGSSESALMRCQPAGCWRQRFATPDQVQRALDEFLGLLATDGADKRVVHRMLRRLTAHAREQASLAGLLVRVPSPDQAAARQTTTADLPAQQPSNSSLTSDNGSISSAAAAQALPVVDMAQALGASSLPVEVSVMNVLAAHVAAAGLDGFSPSQLVVLAWAFARKEAGTTAAGVVEALLAAAAAAGQAGQLTEEEGRVLDKLARRLKRIECD